MGVRAPLCRTGWGNDLGKGSHVHLVEAPTFLKFDCTASFSIIIIGTGDQY